MSFFIFTVLWTRLSVSVCSISLFRPGTHCCPAKNHYKTITDFFCSRLSSFGFDWLDKTRPSTCNIRQYRRPCRRCIGGIWEPGLNPKLPLARERYFSCPYSGSRAERPTSSSSTPHHSWTRERVWAFQRPSFLRPAFDRDKARQNITRAPGCLHSTERPRSLLRLLLDFRCFLIEPFRFQSKPFRVFIAKQFC